MCALTFPDAYRNHDTLARLDKYYYLERNLVFIFFDPWTILTRKDEGLLQTMLRYGFSIVDFSSRKLQEGDIEQLYRKNKPIRGDNSWHIAKQVYLMGTSCGILLYHDGQEGSATEIMGRLKGKSNPTLNAPGHLRYDFRAPNRSLSLMHSSDD